MEIFIFVFLDDHGGIYPPYFFVFYQVDKFERKKLF